MSESKLSSHKFQYIPNNQVTWNFKHLQRRKQAGYNKEGKIKNHMQILKDNLIQC